MLQTGTNIAVRTVGRARISNRGCVCPCKCGAVPKYISGGRVYVKNREIANAPVYLRKFLLRQRALIEVIQDSDVCKHWKIPENLSSGIFNYISIKPTEYSWKLKLKKLKFKKRYQASNGELEVPKTDDDLYEMVSSDEDMEDKPYKSPELLQAELCICFCSCNGAPVVKAPSMPIMQRAVAAKQAATVYFDPPLNNGNAPVTGYQITSIPENIIKTGKESPIKIKGLSIGVWYQFVVRARNRRGLGPPSAPSNQVLISDDQYVAALEEVMMRATEIEDLKVQQEIRVEKDKQIQQKSLQQIQDEDLSPLFERIKFKHKLADFSQIRKVGNYAKHKYGQKRSIKKHMLSYQTTMIPRSLYSFQKEFCESDVYYAQLKQMSLECFENILIFMGDKHKGNRGPVEAAIRLLKTGQSHPMIRDEIYCQLIKQLSDNDQNEKLELGFKLLYLCLSLFEYSQEMSLIILSKIAEYAKPKGFSAFRDLSETAANCYQVWKQTNENGMRVPKQSITSNDVEKILNSKAEAIRLEIYLPDTTRLRLKVSPFFTMSELIKLVCFKFGLVQNNMHKHFKLRIIANMNKYTMEINNYREDTEVAHWYGKWTDIVKKHPLIRFRIVLYKWRWTKSDFEITRNHSKGYVRFLYFQAKNMVSTGKIHMGISDAAMLGSLQMVIENKGEIIPRHAITSEMVQKVIPMYLRETVRMDDWTNQLFDNMKSLGTVLDETKNARREGSTFLSKLMSSGQKDSKSLRILVFDWQRMYVNYLASNVSSYGSSHFEVEFELPKKYNCQDKTDKYLLGLNWHCVSICLNDESNVLKTHELEIITDLEAILEDKKIQFTVGYDSTVTNEGQTLYMFRSEWANQISSLMGAWIAQKMQQNDNNTRNLLI